MNSSECVAPIRADSERRSRKEAFLEEEGGGGNEVLPNWQSQANAREPNKKSSHLSNTLTTRDDNLTK